MNKQTEKIIWSKINKHALSLADGYRQASPEKRSDYLNWATGSLATAVKIQAKGRTDKNRKKLIAKYLVIFNDRVEVIQKTIDNG